MSSKQSQAGFKSNAIGTSNQGNKTASTTSRRRKSSSAKKSSQSRQQDSESSSKAKPKEALSVHEAQESPSTEHTQDPNYSQGSAEDQGSLRPYSHSESRSEESASSSSPEPSPSPSHSDAETTPIYAPQATSPRIHPLLASLRSSSSRSPSRPGQATPVRPPFSSSPHLSPFPSHLHHLSPTRSRPATPSESEPEATSIQTQPTQRTHSVPSHEYYGFALYISSLSALLIYVLWSFLPHAALHGLGIYYYPDRWWSLAIPAWIVMAIAFVYVALARYNIEYLTLPMRSLATVVDEVGVVAVLDGQGRIVKRGVLPDEIGWRREWVDAWSVSTDAVLDVPLGGVCEILYGDG